MKYNVDIDRSVEGDLVPYIAGVREGLEKLAFAHLVGFANIGELEAYLLSCFETNIPYEYILKTPKMIELPVKKDTPLWLKIS